MRRNAFLVSLLATFLATSAAAQGYYGGTGGMTLLSLGDDLVDMGTVLLETEYQFAWSSLPVPRHYGGLVALAGVAKEAGGQIGSGYRHYIRAGEVYPGFGISGFVLDDGTPGITKKTWFGGVEALLEIPMETSTITGFVAVYPWNNHEIDDAILVRTGIRIAAEL